MYGLVNQAIKNLVTERFGESAWKDVCTGAGAPEDFVAMEYYPDQVTYALVGAASQKFGLAADIILHEFGKHWVQYTNNEGYGSIMDLFGSDYKSCLMNLNDLHARMGMTMPKLSPPRFGFAEVEPNVYRIDYFSKRSGLGPMVAGLLVGLAERHNVDVDVTIVPAVGEAQQSFLVVIKGG